MNIIVVDDDNLAAMSVKTILEAGGNIKVIAIGNSGETGVELYFKLHPEAVLMDIRMGEKTGLWAAEEILKRDSEAKILFLTTFSDDEYIIKALKLGAKGYILKQDFPSIEPALLAVKSGQSVFGGIVAGKLPSLMNAGETFDYRAAGISEREQDIIRLIAEGYSNKEIASQLFLVEGTVRNYISVILEKLELRDRTQLAVFYTRHKTVDS